MSQAELFPRIQSHGHYPFEIVTIAAKVPFGQSKKVFNNWDAYLQHCKEFRKTPTMQAFKQRYFYDAFASA